jgi:hypothetical protein
VHAAPPVLGTAAAGPTHPGHQTTTGSAPLPSPVAGATQLPVARTTAGPGATAGSTSSGPGDLPQPPITQVYERRQQPSSTTTTSSSSTSGVIPAAQRSSNAPIVAVLPTVNQHAMQTRGKSGISQPRQIFNLFAIPADISKLPKTYRGALSDPNWKIAMEEEYGVSLPIKHGILCHRHHMLILFQANGSIVTSTMLMDLWLGTRLGGLCADSLSSTVLTMMKPSVPWSSPLPSAQYYRSSSLVIGLLKNAFLHGTLNELFIASNLLGLLIRDVLIMCASSTKPYTVSNRPHERGTSAFRNSLPQLVLGLLSVTIHCSSTLKGQIWPIFCYMWMILY